MISNFFLLPSSSDVILEVVGAGLDETDAEVAGASVMATSAMITRDRSALEIEVGKVEVLNTMPI